MVLMAANLFFSYRFWHFSYDWYSINALIHLLWWFISLAQGPSKDSHVYLSHLIHVNKHQNLIEHCVFVSFLSLPHLCSCCFFHPTLTFMEPLYMCLSMLFILCVIEVLSMCCPLSTIVSHLSHLLHNGKFPQNQLHQLLDCLWHSHIFSKS